LGLSFCFWFSSNSVKVLKLFKTKIVSFSLFESSIQFTVTGFNLLFFKQINDDCIIIKLDLLFKLNLDFVESSFYFFTDPKDSLKRTEFKHFILILLVLFASPIHKRLTIFAVVVSFGIQEFQNSFIISESSQFFLVKNHRNLEK